MLYLFLKVNGNVMFNLKGSSIPTCSFRSYHTMLTGGRHSHNRYRIWRETFEGENLCEFRSFVAVCESFLRKIWGHGVLWCGTNEQSAKIFSAKIIFFTNSQKFSPLKVSHYTVFYYEVHIFAPLYFMHT